MSAPHSLTTWDEIKIAYSERGEWTHVEAVAEPRFAASIVELLA